MLKKKFFLFFILLTLLLTSCSNERNAIMPSETTNNHIKVPWNYGINPEKIPDVVSEDDFSNFKLGSIEKIYGFAGKDVSHKDFTKLSLDFISGIAFDSDTLWCHGSRLPKGFSPDLWLETGKDPGLQIKKLHDEGYTGKGISVAIIDKPILSTHQELKGHTIYTPIGNDTGPHFHGLSCASILAGKTCGVVPESKLYYFATPDEGKNFYNYSLAIDELIKINHTLAPKDKIRIVSVSDGLNEQDNYYQDWNSAMQKAKNEGIIVLYSNNIGPGFVLGGCPPYKDRDNPLNYTIASYLKSNGVGKSVIIIPGDFRTTACNQSENGFVYWGDGGWSWAIPYIAGLCALGLEVDPTLSYEKMQEILVETKSITSDGYSVINPMNYIEKLKSLRK